MDKAGRPQWGEPLRRHGIITAVALLALALYWWLLLGHLQDKRDDLQEQTRIRADQIAAALASQTETLFSGLDVLTTYLAVTCANNSPQVCDATVRSLLANYPDSIVQVTMANASGELIYSSLNPPGQRFAPLGASIADRAHFQAHLDAHMPSLFISKPVIGRLSGKWSIQLSRPILRQGELAGVIVVSVAPHYLARTFRDTLPNPSDVIVLLHDSDGAYLARSRDEEQVFGKHIQTPPSLLIPRGQKKRFQVRRASVDGIERIYVWQRLGSYPLIVGLGLDTEAPQAALERDIHDTVLRNQAGSGVLIAGLLLFQWLLWQRRQATRWAQRSDELLRQTMAAVNDGMWEWDLPANAVTVNRRCCEILGYPARQMRLRVARILLLTHPADRDKLKRHLRERRKLCGMLRQEFRLRHADGHWAWVEVRGDCANGAGDAPSRMLGTLSDIDERMRQSNLRRVLLDENAAAIILASPDRQITYANLRAHIMFAPNGVSLIDRSFRDLHKSDESFEHFGRYYPMLRAQGRLDTEYELRFADGSTRWCDVQGTLLDPDDPDSQVIWTILDSDDRHRTEAALRLQQQRLSSIIDRFPGHVMVQEPDGPIAAINHAFADLLQQSGPPCPLGPASAPELLKRLHALLPPDAREHAGLQDDGNGDLSCEFNLPDGRHFELHRIPLRSGGQPLGLFWMARDITVAKHREMALMQQALTDTLTGLPNRRALVDHMQRTLSAIHGGQQSAGSVLMVDIDFFKKVNDTWGHAVGDEVLRHLATLLRDAFNRPDDMAGRIGGEEFAVVLPQTSQDNAWMLAENLRITVARTPAQTSAGPVDLAVSIGLSTLQARMTDIQEALAQADEALYSAKRSGRNRTVIWSREMGQRPS